MLFVTFTNMKRVLVIQRCQWNRDECAGEMIIVEQTDLGQCYTFNANTSNPLVSDVTGNELVERWGDGFY